MLRLSPETLRAAYDFLRTTAPYKGWKLPPGDCVKFVVSRSKKVHGTHELMPSGKHCIRISEGANGHTDSLIISMSHEMIHLHQAHNATPGRKSDHGEEFQAYAKVVCDTHGFDFKAFV